jgi:hypothetical protein
MIGLTPYLQSRRNQLMKIVCGAICTHLVLSQWYVDHLFSDDFCFKINKLVCNLAHIFILRIPLIILFNNIVYLERILHFRRWKPSWKLGVNHPTIGISQNVHTNGYEYVLFVYRNANSTLLLSSKGGIHVYGV